METAAFEIEPVILKRPDDRRQLSAFTVDVEDWYQSCVDFDAPITERVLRNTDRLLAVLDEADVKATFFVQGRVAETFPQLVATLRNLGHEIQSHGYSHRPLHGMNRSELRDELERSKQTVEDAAGVAVTSFRAQDFSILSGNLWALEQLAEVGFSIDSSIFPTRSRHYGIRGWHLGPHRVRLTTGAEILEVPVAIWATASLRIPVAGGGYFRVLPARLLERGLREIVADGRPAVVYCHPYEFNRDETREYRGRVSRLTLASQGLGRGSFVDRVRRLLQRMPFGRFDETLASWGLQ